LKPTNKRSKSWLKNQRKKLKQKKKPNRRLKRGSKK
jgi:hypothetical protein